MTLGKCKDRKYPPVLSVWISTDGHYAFIEFRTIADAEECRDIGHFKLLGRDLRVGKTKLATGLSGVQSFAETEISAAKSYNFQAFDQLLSDSPTMILLFGEVLDLSQVTSEDDFVAVEVDFRREC